MRVLCLGDSIMQYNDWTSYPQTGWVQLLDRFFVKGTEFLNFARNGRSTKSFIAEGRFDSVLEAAESGDFALIQFGHNDEKNNDPDRYTSPEKGGEFRKNLSFFVKELEKKGVKSILLTPVTRRNFVEEFRIDHSHGVYPAAIIETAAELGIPCLDLTAKTAEHFEKLGEKESCRYFMNFEKGLFENYPEGRGDNSHLRPDGAYVVSRLFVSALLMAAEENSTCKELASFVCTKGIYEDKEIDDERLMWK